MNIKKGDKVVVVKGKDRGKSGKVLRVIPRDDSLVVDEANLRKKTIRPKQQGDKGQVVEVPWPMKSANVMLVCSSCGKQTRAGFRMEGNKKVRYCKKCKQTT